MKGRRSFQLAAPLSVRQPELHGVASTMVQLVGFDEAPLVVTREQPTDYTGRSSTALRCDNLSLCRYSRAVIPDVELVPTQQTNVRPLPRQFPAASNRY